MSMLDAFKKGKQQQTNELQSLIAASREARAALSTMLTQIQLHGAKLAGASKSLLEVEEKAGKANARLDDLAGRLANADARASELAAIDARINAVSDPVASAAPAT